VTLAPGTRLGPYEVDDLLGAGGMGEVYRARDGRLGRMVAVKVIRGAAARGDADRLRRFELEARAAGLLNHPNVLAIHDVGTHEDSPYLVSELLEGETLRTRLTRGPLIGNKAVDAAAQIATGLAAAHAKGIVHRDLKPDNLFLTRDGRVKILDFGLAKLIESEVAFGVSGASTVDSPTEPGRFVGTVNYMSPEAVRGQAVDHRSDIFAFGAVLYEMLTARRAFDRGSPIETMNAALKEDPAPADTSEWPRGVEPIVRRCLEKDPDHRFQSANDLAFHLLTLSTTGSDVRSTAAALQRPPAGRRRLQARWVPWAAGGLVALLMVLGAFTAGMRLGQPGVPSYQQLTFRRGFVFSARFAPDGQTIVYGASWEGRPFLLYSTRAEGPESRPFDLPPSDILAISRAGEMAVSLGRRYIVGSLTLGTLARVPLVGGAARQVLTDVEGADWSPDGRDLAVTRVVDGRYRLEYPIGRVLYETSGWVSHPRVSPDGRSVAFIDHHVYADDRGFVAVIGTGDAPEKRTLTPEWSSVNGLAWTPGGDEVWFTAAEQGPNCALRATDLSGRGRLLLRSAGRLMLQDLRPDGRVLLTDGRFRIGMAHRDVRNRSERDLSWLDVSVVGDLSPDGRTLLFSQTTSGGGAGMYSMYARDADGSPAVRLGEGLALALSPDGKWAVSTVHGTPSHLVVWPTGAGHSRVLPDGGLVDQQSASWTPDGRQVVFMASGAGRPPRLYVQDVEGNGEPRPASPEGVQVSLFAKPVAPDGRTVAAVDNRGRVVLQPLDGAAAREVDGLEPGDVPLRWTRDGRGLYVFRFGEVPGRVHRFDLDTRARELLTELMPADPAGVGQIIAVQVTADGRSCAYSYKQNLADLFLVSGLR
jgi:eukaryotic-like serine/threonine-protein kinase